MRKPKIFSEFYSKQKNDIYQIEDAILDSVSENMFRNDMFCPECNQAQLTLVAKTSNHRAYLKRIPSSLHTKWCSFNYEYATKKIIQEYVNLLSDSELKDKLDAIMRLLCKPELVHSYLTSSDVCNNSTRVSPMLIPSKVDSFSSLKALRRKKLGTYIDQSENGILYAFYGKAQLKIYCCERKNTDSNKKYKIHFLNVFAPNSKKEWKQRASFYLGTNPLSIDESALYHIVFIGYPKFENKYPKIELIKNRAFVYQKIE